MFYRYDIKSAPCEAEIGLFFQYLANFNYLSYCFPKFLFADSFWVRKITADPHVLAHANRVSG